MKTWDKETKLFRVIAVIFQINKGFHKNWNAQSVKKSDILPNTWKYFAPKYLCNDLFTSYHSDTNILNRCEVDWLDRLALLTGIISIDNIPFQNDMIIICINRKPKNRSA